MVRPVSHAVRRNSRGEISRLCVGRNGRPSSIRMTELLVGTTLPDLGKAEMLQNRSHLQRLERRCPCHDQGSETR